MTDPNKFYVSVITGSIPVKRVVVVDRRNMKEMEMANESLEGLFDTQTVSTRFGISRQTLDKARARGEISFYRISAGRVRYSRRHILDYLAKVEQTSVTPAAAPPSHESNKAA